VGPPQHVLLDDPAVEDLDAAVCVATVGDPAGHGLEQLGAEIYNAEDRDHALKAVEAFQAGYGVKWLKAVAMITDHADVLLEFYNYPPSTGSTFAPQTP
jgi:transposase-like protein